MKKLWIITAGIILLIIRFKKRLIMFNPIRGNDAYGSGHFGASRGNRPHLGIDLVTNEGETIYSPLEMFIDRTSRPYFDDTNLTGIKFTTTIDDVVYDGRMWYFTPDSNIVGVFVDKGQALGTAQDLKYKYDTITNHIHIQLRTKDNVSQTIPTIDYNGWTYIDPSYVI